MIIRNLKARTIETEGNKLLLDAMKFIGIGRLDKIPNYLSIFQLGPD
jgi:hypothetical protein